MALGETIKFVGETAVSLLAFGFGIRHAIRTRMLRKPDTRRLLVLAGAAVLFALAGALLRDRALSDESFRAWARPGGILMLAGLVVFFVSLIRSAVLHRRFTSEVDRLLERFADVFAGVAALPDDEASRAQFNRLRTLVALTGAVPGDEWINTAMLDKLLVERRIPSEFAASPMTIPGGDGPS
jgi:hypothetical protein